LLEYLSGNQPEMGPHAMILGHLRSDGAPQWLENLYRSADAIFFQTGPIAVPNQDLLDAHRRLGEWRAYRERLHAGTVPPWETFWFLEVPPYGDDPPADRAEAHQPGPGAATRRRARRVYPDDLAEALQLLDAWTATPPPPRPTAWSAVARRERDLIRGALISLYLEDLADEMAGWDGPTDGR
jgi:hypothetical protein